MKSITDNVGYNGASSPRFFRSAQSPHEIDHEPTRSSKQNEGDVVNNNNDDESPSMFDHGPIDIDDFDGCLREYEAERKQDDEELASNACDGNQSDGDSDANDARSDTGESASPDVDVDEGAILDQSITFSDDENEEESIDVEQDSSDEEEPLSDVAPFSNQKSRADRRETPHANVERAISVTQPKGFLSHVRLFDHQISGIEWMLKREGDSKCRGGILADEPGLGKTLTVAGLLLHAKQHVEHYRPPPQVWDALGKRV